MFAIVLILMVTGACVWIVLAAIVIGFMCAMINNKLYQRKKRINADKLAKERVERWVGGNKKNV